MLSADAVLKRLKAEARPDQLEGMARYGMTVERRLGVAIPNLRLLARTIGPHHRLALALWKSGIPDAMILASMVDVPEEVTEAQMEEWVKDFDSWDVCDQVCMNLFEKTPHARKKILAWSKRKEEFVRRAAFALIACRAWHDKEAADGEFIRLIPVITIGATDGRPMVKKAVSWALRNIGKRNAHLNAVAIEAAKKLKVLDSKPARWIAADVLRDLTASATMRRIRNNS